MLHIIKGDVGSGKTTYITELISRAIGEKKRCFLIVPEQQTVSAERFMAEKLHPSFPLYLEITNFSRLANTVFRTYGGISYNYSSEAVRSLIMWKTLGELLPCLHENKSDIEAGRVKRMLSAISELHSASVSAEDLKKAIDSTKEERLKEKLEDLYLISTLYTSLLKEHYSDQSEDLDRLSDVLAENDFFSDAIVVIDSFTSFTPQEYKVISAIMRQCELFVTLTLPSESERSACFEEIERAKNSLKSCAMNNRIALDEVKLGESKRNPSPLMRYVAKNMTSPIAKQLKPYESEEKKGEALRIIECPDPYTEADFVAFDIKRRVQAGARYRDFSVFARTASSYEGILDSALKKYNIPYFMSVRSDVSSFAPIKMICSAYSVIASNFNRSDLITYMKCSLSGISEKDCDDFEIYTKKWNVNGNRFIDGIDWNMSPQGYVSKKDDRYADFLIRINETKKKLISPLESLYTFASENHTVKEHCRALFEFLQSISLEKQLYELAEREEKEGNLQESDNYRRIFSVICETLDLLCDTLPDTVLNAEGFSSLLRIVFSETNIGQIPAQLDAVTVGSADMLRAESEHIYLFGVNSGEFPATVSDNSFFSQSDRATLCALGLELENDLSENASRESFCIYRAFASAKNSVTLLYSLLSASYTAQTPSAVIENIKHLAGDFVSLTRYDAIKEMDKLWDRDSSFEMLGKISDGAEKRALFDILSEDEDYERRLSTLKKPITTNNALLSSDTSKIIYPSDVNMTSSRIEKYAKCAFSYYCDYIMSLKAHDDIKIDFLSIGNLVHSILENLFLYLEKHGKEIFELEKEELEEVVSQITSA
ncbi:MAG: PD-(D/E)XK nuclease family protein [Clostridia bacterium]|nr:PD-(D/E)XK nuclease family protein [Clostridia bacterium]